MSELKKIRPSTFELPKEGQMLVPGLIIGNEEDLHDPEMEKPLQQVRNVACLPGIVGYSVAMPDIHWGYGFPIGGVAAMDAETGVISPGGVGYDINCGVRLALVPLPFASLHEKQKKDLIHTVFKLIPSGTGMGHKREALSSTDYRALIERGAAWSIEQGYGYQEDLEHIESNGLLEDADLSAVSDHAQSRGKSQIGSIGSGNHFVEIGEVETIYDQVTASRWGVEKGMTYILIHTGSRGFGHQICQDTLNDFIKKGFAKGLPDKQLVAAPLRSEEGSKYWAAMAAAANFAFNNRQRILHDVRTAFQQTLGIEGKEIKLLYDVCHNIAKMETHIVDGAPMRLCVHRKGATRAYGKGSESLSPLFRETGQPVLVPGDMGRASHLMVGLGNPLTFSSACHGAGRARSRVKSKEAWAGKEVFKHMRSMGTIVVAHSSKTVLEEMPDAYKDVDRVVEAVHNASLAGMVGRLHPKLVLKG